MGFLTDIRAGDRGDGGLGGYAIVFWAIAGLAVGGGLGSWAGLGIGIALLCCATAGLALGLGVGFYAAFGAARTARILALPGVLLGMIGMVVGI